jgi:transcriptional regulator with XRE-family HTH domain
MKKLVEDNAINKYIRERIKKARTETGESQSELAKILNVTFATISDMERGRTAINAAVLVQIAHHYKKSITFFYPEEANIKLSRIEEEMLNLFQQLPTIEQYAEIDHLREKIKKQKGKRK